MPGPGLSFQGVLGVGIFDPRFGQTRTPVWRPQVLRDSHYRLAIRGAKRTSGDRDDWNAMAISFFRKTGESLPDKRRRLKRERRTLPRLAALDVMRSLQAAIVNGLGVGFEVWDNSAQMPKLPEPYRPPPPPSDEWCAEVLSLPTPSLLVYCADQDAKQMCMWRFMREKLRLCFMGMRDPFHRM